MTVVVVVVEGTQRLWRCLEALDKQAERSGVEVVVPWNVYWGAPADFQTAFKAIEFPIAEGRRTPAELRTFGVQRGRGKIVALIEDHCRPADDWCVRIIQAHGELSHAAVGGVVEKETPDRTINWAVFLADYLRYMKPVPKGPSQSLTDVNVSYKRQALEAIADVWHSEFHEPSVHSALTERGKTLWLCPDIMVHQRRNFSWRRAIQDRYTFGRLFGSTRVSGASVLQRFWRVAMSPFILPLLVARVAGHVFRKRRCRQEFLRCLPALFVISSLWALGECIGYVTGKPDASLTPGPKSFPDSREALA